MLVMTFCHDFRLACLSSCFLESPKGHFCLFADRRSICCCLCAIGSLSSLETVKNGVRREFHRHLRRQSVMHHLQWLPSVCQSNRVALSCAQEAEFLTALFNGCASRSTPPDSHLVEYTPALVSQESVFRILPHT